MTNLAEKKEAPAVPSVWIGCLAAYNSGRLHGEWVEIPTDPEELREEIKRVLDKSPEPMADEWAFMDYEYVPDEFGENPDLDKLCDYVSLTQEYSVNAVGAFIHCFSLNDLDNFSDAYIGCYDSFNEFANEQADIYLDDNYQGHDFIKQYFDYESYARDLSYDYSSEYVGGCEYVFSNY